MKILTACLLLSLANLAAALPGRRRKESSRWGSAEEETTLHQVDPRYHGSPAEVMASFGLYLDDTTDAKTLAVKMQEPGGLFQSLDTSLDSENMLARYIGPLLVDLRDRTFRDKVRFYRAAEKKRQIRQDRIRQIERELLAEIGTSQSHDPSDTSNSHTSMQSDPTDELLSGYNDRGPLSGMPVINAEDSDWFLAKTSSQQGSDRLDGMGWHELELVLPWNKEVYSRDPSPSHI